jgi:hypothetical protein
MNNRNIKILEEGIIGIFKRRVMLSETTAQVRFLQQLSRTMLLVSAEDNYPRRGSKIKKLKKEKKTRMRRNVLEEKSSF